jgi:hypothetical protein
VYKGKGKEMTLKEAIENINKELQTWSSNSVPLSTDAWVRGVENGMCRGLNFCLEVLKEVSDEL